ncbi:TonB-dependent receptor [Flavobacterium sp. IMCC34852]|uniref:TonB-dependent receptor n=1 Tax=Flavobacterium rivulicola TaxID=2732161 RepID=A0A7Y3R734_9FLAO|nr:TonB-dependent receptor [Flavobacterium sp. IMCC34852]NNT70761.1 TonB-dependent receptor [Flavobacterium sp. IMCC34852]
MKLKFIVTFLLISVIGFAQGKGTITGTLTDKDLNNEPLPFANVVIKGTTTGVTTDETGKYTIAVEAGIYTIQFSFLGYETIEEKIEVKAGETLTINKALGSGSYQLQDVVIQNTVSREKETALLLEQKKSVEIKQSIGAQEMSRKGVSTVEEGLTKITGISKVESKGLFIRGLEDRYNSLLLNGLAVPSNSPFKKIIPLDQFPTDVVGYMDVFKTFNPDIYGDFAGATIDVITSQTQESQTKLSYGVGYTTNNNGSDFLLSTDADNTKSFFGFGGQERQLPSGYGAIPNGRIENDYKSSWDVNKTTSPLNTSFGVSHSGKFYLGKEKNKLNYVFATNFDNTYQIRKGVDRTFSQGQGIYDNNLVKEEYKFQTQSSVLVGLQYKTDRMKLLYNTLYLKSTENLIQDQVGYTRTAVDNPNEFIRLNQYEQSDYLSHQFFGNYKITSDDKHSVKGGLSYTRTQYSQPDRKFITGTRISDTEINTQYGSNNLLRQFFNIDNNFHLSGNLEYNYKFGKNEDKKHKFSFGYNGFAEYMVSKFRFTFGVPNSGAAPYNVVVNEIDQAIQDDIASNFLSFTEQSSAEWKTKVAQRADALYTKLLFNFTEKLELNVGLRAENTIREYKYKSIVDPINNPYRKKNNENLYILPSVNVKYAVNDKSNLRLAASKTYTKPVLFESLDINLINADGTTERGNSDIENSENYNIDLKFEMFPTKNELFAATLFTKYIDNPIERTVQASATGSGQTITYFNNKSATLFGAEFEFIVQLSRLHKSLEGFSFGTNTSLMITEATVNKNRDGYFDTFEKRKLQGASGWLVNSDLKYEFELNSKWKNTTSLVYNVYGERIYAVGVAGNDHIYEKPFHKLDFVWGSNINKKWDIKFSIDNILNPTYKRVLGDNSEISINESSLLLESYKKGVGFSTSLSYTF